MRKSSPVIEWMTQDTFLSDENCFNTRYRLKREQFLDFLDLKHTVILNPSLQN